MQMVRTHGWARHSIQLDISNEIGLAVAALMNPAKNNTFKKFDIPVRLRRIRH